MKKARILFVLCLVAVLALGMALSVSAAEPAQTADIISLTIEPPMGGDMIPEGDLPATEYSIIIGESMDNGYSHLDDVIASVKLSWNHMGAFSGGKEYTLSLTVTLLEEKAQFAENVLVIVNDNYRNTYTADTATELRCTDLPIQATSPRGTHVNIKNLPHADEGKPIEAYSYTNHDDGYSLTGQWFVYDYDNKTWTAAAGTFENGKLYRLKITSQAAEGFAFADPEMWVDEDDVWYHQDESVSTSTSNVYYVPRPCGEFYGIQDAYMNGVPKQISAGQTAPAVTLTADENVELVATWQDENGNPFTGTFETGKVYYLRVEVSAKAGAWLSPRISLYDKEAEIGQYFYTDGVSGTTRIRYSLIPKVESVEVSGVTGAVVGQAPTTQGIRVPTGANYALSTEYTSWRETYEGNYDFTVFENGKKYSLEIAVLINDGFEFSDDLTVSVDGIPVERDHWSIGSIEETPCIWIGLDYSFLQVIDKVDITGVTDAVIGQTPTTQGIRTTTEGVVLSTEECWWYEAVDYILQPVGGNFENGHRYMLSIRMYADKGYEFAQDVEFTVNGQPVEDAGFGYGGDSSTCDLSLEYSFVTLVEKIEITGATDAVVGQTATTQGITSEVADLEAGWYDEEGELFTGTFENGKKYYLVVKPMLKQGYEYGDRRTVTINGKTPYEWYGDREVYYYLEYSFRTVTQKIEITGVVDAVVGQTATVEGIQVSGAEMNSAGWVDYYEDGMFTGAFADGRKYYLIVGFDAKEGFEFTDDTVVTVNGVELDEDSYALNEKEGYIFLTYNFMKIIERIELTGMPQFAVGATASVDGLKAPENAPYQMQTAWAGNEGEFTGVFAADEIYTLYIMLFAEEGYEFAEDLQIFIDGEEAATNFRYIGSREAQLAYVYCAALETVDKLEITVDKPVVGAPIRDDMVKVPEGAPYVVEGRWYVSTDGRRWDTVTEGVFEEGKHYRLELNVELDDSKHMLANNATMSVNGVTLVMGKDDCYMGSTYAYAAMDYKSLCSHTYGDWTCADGKTHSQTCSKCGDVATAEHDWESDKDAKCDTCGYDRSDNPPTGDAVVPAALLALCSVAALVVINKRRSVR